MEEKEVHSTEIYPVGNFDWPASTNGVTVIGEEPKPKKSMYRFFVGDPRDIDIQRVCDEAESDVVLLTGAEGEGLLLVRKTFLARFIRDDYVMLGIDPACPEWGYGRVSACQHGHRATYTFSGPNYQTLEDWRAIIVALEDMGVIAAQIKKARAYKRRIQVKVHYL